VISKSASGAMGVSYPLYAALRDRVGAFSGMSAEMQVTATMVSSGTPVAAKGVLVTGNYFELLGVKAAIGRLLATDDDAGRGAVVLTYGYWQRQFGGEPSVLNRTVRLNQLPLTIVGVAEQSFTGTVAGDPPDFYAPLSTGAAFVAARPPFRFDSAIHHMYKVVARLTPGINLKQAERAGEQVYQQLLAEALSGAYQADRDWIKRHAERYHLRLLPGGYASSDQSALSRDLRTPLLLVMAMVSLVLLIAAGNVANLVLAREEARSHEIATRFALGASSWRLLRPSLVESLLLALLAGSAGLLLAQATSGLAPVVLDIGLPDGVTPAPDTRTCAATFGLALLAGVGIWAVSSWRVVRRFTLATPATQAAFRARHTSGWRGVLVLAQSALSIVLLCSSAVLSRSLIRLMSVDPGFPIEGLYSFELDPGQAGYDPARAGRFMARVLELIGEIPGVRKASITTHLPLSAQAGGGFLTSEGAANEDAVGAEIAYVGPGHFANLEIAMTAGREFERDDAGGARIALVSESLAQQLFGGTDPIERRIGLQGGTPEWRIVGVVRDVRCGPRDAVKPSLYLPYDFRGPARTRAAFVLRGEKNFAITREMVQAVVGRIDAAMVVQEFGSMSEQAARALYRDRMLAFLSLCFGVLAALLCAIGIFGLTSFSVTKRTREIGVRIALGASGTSIRRMVMTEASVPAVTGCGLGLGVFLLACRGLSSVVFEVAPNDPLSLAVGSALLVGTALLAAFLPACRATRVDPACALREE
jgi:predicted permease